jgi:hypothetical protein
MFVPVKYWKPIVHFFFSTEELEFMMHDMMPAKHGDRVIEVYQKNIG